MELFFAAYPAFCCDSRAGFDFGPEALHVSFQVTYKIYNRIYRIRI